ncbi:MAG: HU family DNA-binding protein [bacterium]
MNKQELIEAVQERAKLTATQAQRAVDAIFSPSPDKGIVAATLKKGDKVAIAGFGTFEVRHRSARKARNPQTGEIVEIAAKRVPTFHAGKTLKDRIT